MKNKIGNFTYEKREDGSFLYKADENLILEKTKLKDKPQYPLLENIQESMNRSGKIMIQSNITQINNFLNKLQ